VGYTGIKGAREGGIKRWIEGCVVKGCIEGKMENKKSMG
jgi:hypothetical protein